MAHHHRDLAFDDFMKGCGGFSDCAFEVIDALPSQDVNIQLERCHRYVIADRKDCISHAMQRWLNTSPTEKEVSAFLERDPYYTNEVMYFVAEHNYCQSWNLCIGDSNNAKKCRSAMKKVKKNRNPCRGRWGNMSK